MELMQRSELDIWAKIQTANASIKTTDLKGKSYAEVNQRVKAFRFVYPDGRIETEIVHLEGEEGRRRILMRATCFDGEGRYLADGLAEEKESSTFINKTSFIENCQTSAIGRALGFAGFGIDVSIASAEEVENAIANQDDDGVPKTAEELHRRNEEAKKRWTATANQIDDIRKRYDEENIQKMLEFYHIDSLRDMRYEDAETVIKRKPL